MRMVFAKDEEYKEKGLLKIISEDLRILLYTCHIITKLHHN